MRKSFLVFLLVICVVILAVYVFVSKTDINKSDDEYQKKSLNQISSENRLVKSEAIKDDEEYDNKIIIEKSYTNFAWGYQYSGTAILDDGSIYEWNFSGGYQDSKEGSLQEKADWIIENGNLKNKKVSQNDLEKLKEFINDVDDSIELEPSANDAGTTAVYIWNYDEDKKITLEQSGDFSGKNESAKKVLNIVKKYM